MDTQEWCDLIWNENIKFTTCKKDIFLLNDPRATSHKSCNDSLLESIKDGTAVSWKYKYDVMRFKIPNVVVVFSNHMPNTRELSKDRWKILQIENTGLKGTTIQVWKTQHGNETFESNLKKKMMMMMNAMKTMTSTYLYIFAWIVY